MKKLKEPIPEGRRIAGRVFLGLCLAVAGVLLLLNNLGSLPYNFDWRFWPLFLAALAGARMVERGVLRTGPHVLVLVALFLLAVSFERDDLLERWWPLSVVWFGVLMTLRAVLSKPKQASPPCEDEPERQS
jgi:hypothetical protein